MTDFKKQGKRNRANGAAFERRVRKELEEIWNVSKYQNNLDYPKENTNLPPEERKDLVSIPAKASRFRLSSTGFPDFICYRPLIMKAIDGMKELQQYDIIFVEAKIGGKLDKIEKAKAKWYLENNYCSKFYIAKKTKVKNRIKILYFEVKLEESDKEVKN